MDEDEVRRWSGRWKRPDMDDGNAVGGELTFDDNRVRLTLHGTIAPPDAIKDGVAAFPLDPEIHLAVVHGQSKRPITVLGARCNYPLNPFSGGQETWRGDAFVEAEVHADESGEARFSGIRL